MDKYEQAQFDKGFPDRDFWDDVDENIKIGNPTIPQAAPIMKEYLRSILEWQRIGNTFDFFDGFSKVRIIVVSENIIRVRVAPRGLFLNDFSYAIQAYSHQLGEVNITETEQEYRISTSKVICIIQKASCIISFTDTNGKLMNMDAIPMHFEENTKFGGYYVYCVKQCNPTEFFYGLGDKPTDFNVRGKQFTMWNTDTYAFERNKDPLYRSIPFYIGVKDESAYGIFFDNTFKTHFDFGYTNSQETGFWSEGGEMNYYYIHGPDMIDVVRNYAMLTGVHSLPPKWALGYHQCRLSYVPDKRLKKIATTFRDKKIPCDALYLDIDYMDGYRCFTWNKKYFPNPQELASELRTMGFRLVVILNPGIKIDENYPIFNKGTSRGYFCSRSDDYFMEGNVWPGRCRFPDFTNPEVRYWWGGLLQSLVDANISGAWTDMNEPAVFGLGTFPDDVRHNYDHQRGSHRKAHNVYGMQMARATFHGFKTLRPLERPFIISRAGYSGSQRFGATWTGDNVASWEHLKLANVMCQRLSISGMSFCGTDIGGFVGDPDSELYVRWLQLGVFTPLMRTHSAADTKDREPWMFTSQYGEIVKKFIELRYKLMPYIYTAFWQHNHDFVPILRPAVMFDQSAQHFFREDEFSFGDALYICPILHQGIKSRKVFIPKGLWYDYWTGESIIGGGEILISVSLDAIPIFIKAGYVVAEQPVMQYVNEFQISELTLKVGYTPKTSISTLYEDDGESMAHKDGISLEKTFTANGNETGWTLTQARKGEFHIEYHTYRIILYGIPFNIKKIMVDNAEIKDFKIEDNNCISFIIPESFTQIEVFAD